MQFVDVEDGIIKFENDSNQLSVPFKIYADFECNLKDIEIYEGSYTKIIMDMFLVVMLITLLLLTLNLVSQLLFIGVKIQLIN